MVYTHACIQTQTPTNTPICIHTYTGGGMYGERSTALVEAIDFMHINIWCALLWSHIHTQTKISGSPCVYIGWMPSNHMLKVQLHYFGHINTHKQK